MMILVEISINSQVNIIVIIIFLHQILKHCFDNFTILMIISIDFFSSQNKAA
mgnify:CR=1 FL=1